jgi:hypothetical protein
VCWAKKIGNILRVGPYLLKIKFQPARKENAKIIIKLLNLPFHIESPYYAVILQKGSFVASTLVVTHHQVHFDKIKSKH